MMKSSSIIYEWTYLVSPSAGVSFLGVSRRCLGCFSTCRFVGHWFLGDLLRIGLEQHDVAWSCHVETWRHVDFPIVFGLVDVMWEKNMWKWVFIVETSPYMREIRKFE